LTFANKIKNLKVEKAKRLNIFKPNPNQVLINNEM